MTNCEKCGGHGKLAMGYNGLGEVVATTPCDDCRCANCGESWERHWDDGVQVYPVVRRKTCRGYSRRGATA